MTVDVQPLRTAAEIAEFRDAIKVSAKSAAMAARNLLLFNIGINTGLRIGDIVKMRIEDVKGRSSFVIREGKTEKMRTVHLSALMADIADYVDALEPSQEYLFSSRKGGANAKPSHISTTQAYRILAAAAELIGRKDIGTHTLRKTFGYHYYKRTHDVATLMEIFNHDSQATTKRYIGIRNDEIAETLRDFKL
ncbi:tyrosine-type recombinase/integrase [Planococcus halocryophilus]|nr:tyrosine-type recombinase/integrase [Planococcus halocryophilus]MCH4827823.1 tyrosine-type recombinase/integrase [Planococcus halocryophilus]